MTKTFNRRDFLKGGLVLGGAAEAAGLAGCAPTTKGDKQQAQLATTGAAGGIPENWDYEADVIVVGCGAAGWWWIPPPVPCGRRVGRYR